MKVFNALRRQPRSISHWGEFDCGRERVELTMLDVGILTGADGEFCESVFILDSKEHRSCIGYDAALVARLGAAALHQRRLDADTRLLESLGIDTGTIDYDNMRTI